VSLVESERVRELLARAGLGELSPAALKGVVAAAALAVGLGVWRFWPTAPPPEVACDESATVVAGESAASVEETAPAEIVVHVAGAATQPGVYRLPLGSRVADAVAAAGGALGSAATDAVNLARLLVDGEQVYLPTHDEAMSGEVGGSGSGSIGSGGSVGSSGGLVNINTASASELDALPGIGPSTAQKIVDDRESNGPFGRAEDLMRVPGIGESKYNALKDLVTAG